MTPLVYALIEQLLSCTFLSDLAVAVWPETVLPCASISVPDECFETVSPSSLQVILWQLWPAYLG